MPRATYANIMSTLAFVVALGAGGAYAAQQVTSAQIKNETIKSKDIKNKQVGGVDLADSAVDSTKLANGSVTGGRLADGSVTGGKVADGSLTGADIDESTLDLKDFSAAGTALGGCTMDAHVPVTCASTSITLARRGRVQVLGTAQWNTSHLDDVAGDGAATDDPTLVTAGCHLEVDGAPFGTTLEVGEQDTAGGPTHPFSAPGSYAIVGLSPALAPGAHTFSALCSELDGDMDFGNFSLAAATVDDGAS